MKASKVAPGIYWVDIPDADLRILCGSPADTVKHLMRRGHIAPVTSGAQSWESGPNAILLSDVAIQNGEFANLAEFPVLQMLYRQGMIIPGHPNNTGRRPLLVGAEDQIAAQREYIFRGNYGLVTEEELREGGVPDHLVAEYMAIKTQFAFGAIRTPDELLDFQVIGDEPVELAEGVSVERVAVNTFRFVQGGEYLEVSLTLGATERYEPPYMLGQHKVKRAYFSVIHTGEGDGWDIRRPCMGSIIHFQGRVYLIDAGPSVMHSLRSLGISVNDIAGIFHTHAHDDHFAGLTSLVRADHKLRYYAAPYVRASVVKKLSALMGFQEDQFDRYFVPIDLEVDSWNDVDGLEVKPVWSPHPVETTVMFFRALWADGYRTYAHLADICTFDQLARLTSSGTPAAREIAKSVRTAYLQPVDVKKIDVGGPPIHGSALDFVDDPSNRIVLSHRSTPYTLHELEIGGESSFGMQDILIRASETGSEHRIFTLLAQNFPGVPKHELGMLANTKALTSSIGETILRRGAVASRVLLLVNGLVEVVDAENGILNTLTPGMLIGERSVAFSMEATRTYRAASFVRMLEISATMYRSFVERNGLIGSLREFLDRKHFLEGTHLFGDRITGSTLNRIAQLLEPATIQDGAFYERSDAIGLVADGTIEVTHGSHIVDESHAFDSFGEAALFSPGELGYRARGDVAAFLVPTETVEPIPVARWKMLEQMNCRRRAALAVTQKRRD